MVATGFNVFVANGGVAGQQVPHFLIQIIPRELGDSIFKYLFDKKKELDEAKQQEVHNVLAKNIPAILRSYFQKAPQKWHTGRAVAAPHLAQIRSRDQLIYEDEKVLCVTPHNAQCLGHVAIYSKTEESHYEAEDEESSAHLFYVASLCASTLYEALHAQGTNLLLKSGVCTDNPDGMLSLHVFPRFPGDGVELKLDPMPKKPNLTEVASKLKDELFMLEYSQKDKKQPELIDLDARQKDVLVLMAGKKTEPAAVSPLDEIERAISQLTRRP
jgi:diadenosine tetraphosphate (Ap4A) HIT family hydrolase